MAVEPSPNYHIGLSPLRYSFTRPLMGVSTIIFITHHPFCCRQGEWLPADPAVIVLSRTASNACFHRISKRGTSARSVHRSTSCSNFNNHTSSGSRYNHLHNASSFLSMVPLMTATVTVSFRLLTLVHGTHSFRF